MLIETLIKTEIKEKQKGILVLCRANKKAEKIFIRANAGKPNAK